MDRDSALVITGYLVGLLSGLIAAVVVKLRATRPVMAVIPYPAQPPPVETVVKFVRVVEETRVLVTPEDLPLLAVADGVDGWAGAGPKELARN